MDLIGIAYSGFCNFGIEAQCFTAQFKLVIRDLGFFFSLGA